MLIKQLLLIDDQQYWQIEKGALALFATPIAAGEPEGQRHFLTTLGGGQLLFGAAPWTDQEGHQWGLLAVAIEPTSVIAMRVIDRPQSIDADATGWLRGLTEWLEQLIQALSPQCLPSRPDHCQVVKGAHYLSLLLGEAVEPPISELIWLKLQRGQSHLLDQPSLVLNPNSPPFPLVYPFWVQASEDVELSTSADLETSFTASLALFHSYFATLLLQSLQQQEQADYDRFQDRQQLNQQSLSLALQDLTTVLQPQVRPPSPAGDPLLMAAGAVGQAMGLSIKPPLPSQQGMIDPIAAIAQASQIRVRQVRLEGTWWQSESSPLLGFTLEGLPVALLPVVNKRFHLYNPATEDRPLIDATIAGGLSRDAYLFYRPLLGVVKSPLQLFQFALRGHEWDLVWVLVVGVLGTLLGMVIPQATAFLINDAIPDGDRLLLGELGLALFAAAVGQSAFQLSQGILTLRVENTADATLQPAIWDRLLRLNPGFFRLYSSGDLLNRVLAVSQIRKKLSGATQRTLLSGIFALLNLGLMVVYSWQLTLVGMGISLLAILVTVVSGLLLVRKSRIQQELEGQINGLTVQLINGVVKLRVAMAEERAFAAWAQQYSQRIRLKALFQRINDAVTVFNDALSLVTSVLLFWFAILFIQMEQATGGGLNVGSFLAFNAAFGIYIKGVTDLSNTLTDILDIVPTWERADPILRSETEIDINKADPGLLRGGVVLEHVTFRYRPDGPLILEDVSLQARAGEFIAIVGPSGSGKSTLFRLLLGFETPLSGSIFYDGQDLKGLNVQALRRQLGVVLQNGRIGSGSIFSNITAGAVVSLDLAWEAARMAGFAEDIEQMPMGMHTVISEGGTNLSGGQRQRLLIARAIVQKPKVILMDEATSALDNRTQAIVTASLDKLQVTRIVIAHRLSTIRNADRIYVLEAGRVVQVGKFEELIAREGLFARLVKRQME
uniref:ABC transporter related n=1 Tax=Cyanothece sp. (strain PCC 7425 / ATCC 29141) TaxID=395961 RepID=B8HM15_CYAP4